MRTAAAEIPVERGPDIGLRRSWVSFQKCSRVHQNTRHAVAALHRLFGDKRSLQRMRMLRAAQSFKGRNLLVRDRPHRRVAGGDRMIFDHDMAGAAFARAATEMCADAE